jgi:PDZ domain
MRADGASRSGLLIIASTLALAALVLSSSARAQSGPDAPAGGSGAAVSNFARPATAPEGAFTPPSTTKEIPPVAARAGASPAAVPSAEPSPGAATNGLTGSGNAQEPPGGPTQLGTLKEFLAEGKETSPIGVRLREAECELSNGEEADGLLVVSVVPGSPAAKAGLRPFSTREADLLTGAAVALMAAATVFPPTMPAMLILPALGYSGGAQSCDTIIAVDGWRVTNFADFEEQMRDVRPGELVYLTVVRDGKHVQITVAVPPTASSGTY